MDFVENVGKVSFKSFEAFLDTFFSIKDPPKSSSVSRKTPQIYQEQIEEPNHEWFKQEWNEEGYYKIPGKK